MSVGSPGKASLGRHVAAIAWALAAAAGAAACEGREVSRGAPTFDDVQPLLEAACTECHGDAPYFGTGDYLSSVGCLGEPLRQVVLPRTDSAPLIRVFEEREDHAALLTPAQRETLRAWVLAGAPRRKGAAHDPRIVNPYSTRFHARTLREARWAPMLDASRDDACGGCHAGAPATPEGQTHFAPQATPCTDCHGAPEGALACDTCHGDDGRIFGPRDPCISLRPGVPDAHPAHLSAGYDCGLCHAPRTTELAEGPHGDGTVDVAFDADLAGEDATWDAATGACAVSCHNLGGARAVPSFTDIAEPLGCGDCHQSPPEEHYVGSCDTCHPGVDAQGTALLDAALHLNGEVDLGPRGEGCAGCHGGGELGWPDSFAHGAHRSPTLTTPIACETCHTVPERVDAEGHLDRTEGVEVRLAGRALSPGLSPSYDGEGCSELACHGAGLSGGVIDVPRWRDDSGAPADCGACHGAPPPPPHVASTGCASQLCHAGTVGFGPDGPRIGPLGRERHIDGTLQVEEAP